jgi:CubicO group peptidase (beta-lactamase class C family)
MRKRNVGTFGAVFAALIAASCSSSEQSSDIPARFWPLAQAVETERAALGVSGVAIAIVEKGEVTFAHGFGVKDARGAAAVEPTTLFRIGSTTKPLTSVAVLQVVQQGLATLDDPVVKHIPGFHLTKTPDAAANIKVRHLLSQNSGLADFGDRTALPAERTDAALETYLTGPFADVEYAGAPAGAVWAYANANYYLAGLVAEKATNTPYRTLMHDRVFAPLEMHRTFFLPSDVVADGDYAVGVNCQSKSDARCFALSAPEVIEPDTYDDPWARPAGMAWSSVLDMAKFARFVVHGADAVLGADLHDAMTSPQAPTKEIGDVESYGFGLFVQDGVIASNASGAEFWPVKFLQHGGDVAGFSSTLICAPVQDVCFIALANANGAHFLQSAFSTLPALVTLPAPTAPPDLMPKTDRYPAYAGTYNDLTVGTFTVVANADKLTIRIPALDASSTPYSTQLVPRSIDTFVNPLPGAPYPLTFIADSNGAYQYIRSRPYIAARVTGP